MGFVRAIPVLLGTLLVPLLGMLAWGFWRVRGHQSGDAFVSARDDLLVALLILAALAFGAFVAYLLLSLGS